MEGSIDERVLAATRAEVVAFGLRRATMTSIAKRAGIGRATLYRRATSLDELVRDALVDDYARVAGELAEVADAAGERTTRADIVRLARTILEKLSQDTLLRALLDHDPELLLPYLVDRLGRSQEILVAGFENALREAQLEGSVRAANPRVLAVGALQALTPFVVSRRVLESVAPHEMWLDEAAHLLDAYLAPKEPA
ncbi:TetR/AcrR family transcriptional regulator [Dermacoccus abyssi]|uniref:TetR/AcrR family transcriptional regulator n=1 Tax=Dermacoccus abyssi TaxID=322596 RepID=UPI0021A8646A|nr:TetR/AcrR family transcriptional regulator [Dermacoccus abyssi]